MIFAQNRSFLQNQYRYTRLHNCKIAAKAFKRQANSATINKAVTVACEYMQPIQ